MSNHMRFERSSGDFHDAVWRDDLGIMHLADGADVHPGVRLLWTACGGCDIPANAAWIKRGEDVVSCQECLTINKASK